MNLTSFSAGLIRIKNTYYVLCWNDLALIYIKKILYIVATRFNKGYYKVYDI